MLWIIPFIAPFHPVCAAPIILPSPLASNTGTQSAVCTARTKFFLVVILPSASGVIIELSSASIISVP